MDVSQPIDTVPEVAVAALAQLESSVLEGPPLTPSDIDAVGTFVAGEIDSWNSDPDWPALPLVAADRRTRVANFLDRNWPLLTSCEWDAECWVALTDSPLDTERFEHPKPGDSTTSGYNKPVGGLWTTPARADGSSPWLRLLASGRVPIGVDEVYATVFRVDHELRQTRIQTGLQIAPFSQGWAAWEKVLARCDVVRFSWVAAWWTDTRGLGLLRPGIGVAASLWTGLPGIQLLRRTSLSLSRPTWPSGPVPW